MEASPHRRDLVDGAACFGKYSLEPRGPAHERSLALKILVSGRGRGRSEVTPLRWHAGWKLLTIHVRPTRLTHTYEPILFDAFPAPGLRPFSWKTHNHDRGFESWRWVEGRGRWYVLPDTPVFKRRLWGRRIVDRARIGLKCNTWHYIIPDRRLYTGVRVEVSNGGRV